MPGPGPETETHMEQTWTLAFTDLQATKRRPKGMQQHRPGREKEPQKGPANCTVRVLRRERRLLSGEAGTNGGWVLSWFSPGPGHY